MNKAKTDSSRVLLAALAVLLSSHRAAALILGDGTFSRPAVPTLIKVVANYPGIAAPLASQLAAIPLAGPVAGTDLDVTARQIALHLVDHRDEILAHPEASRVFGTEAVLALTGIEKKSLRSETLREIEKTQALDLWNSGNETLLKQRLESLFSGGAAHAPVANVVRALNAQVDVKEHFDESKRHHEVALAVAAEVERLTGVTSVQDAADRAFAEKTGKVIHLVLDNYWKEMVPNIGLFDKFMNDDDALHSQVQAVYDEIAAGIAPGPHHFDHTNMTPILLNRLKTHGGVSDEDLQRYLKIKRRLRAR